MRNKLFILVILLLPAPLFFNCQRGSLGPTESRSPDSEDQTVSKFETPAVSPFAASKIILDPAELSIEPSFESANRALLQKASFTGGMSESDEQSLVLPPDLKLLAIVDNDCAARREAARATGRMSKGEPESLSERLRYDNPHVADITRQAYTFSPEEAVTLGTLAQQAEDDGCVIGITRDGRERKAGSFNDTLYAQQKHLASIRAAVARDLFFSPGAGITQDVVIAIVDTGVDYNHSDLRARMWTSPQGTYGRDFENGDEDPMDDDSHGTHLAGLAAAVSDNNVGVAGVMAFHAKIMAIKVLDNEGAGTISNVVNGIYYAADNGADVINLSLGSPGLNAAYDEAMRYAVSKGATVVAAAGNTATELTSTTFFRPASYVRNIDGAFCIGSVDSETRAMSDFSNFGPDYVDIGAPGSNGILSTLPGNQYGIQEGTSMATPITAGAVALVIGLLRTHGQNPTPAQIEQIFMAAALRDPNLASSFRDGRYLDLVALGTYVQTAFIMNATGGMRDQF